MSKQKHIHKPSQAKKVIHPIKSVWAIVIGIITFLLYANTIGHDYALDDVGAITQNDFVQQGFAGIPQLLKVDFWHFFNVHLGYYRPLSLITFAMEHQFFGSNPHVSHFINVLLFAFSGFILFILLSKLFNTYNPAFAFLVSLLFIAHPIHTEIVANIKGRDELLSYLNIILMLWFTLKYIDTKKTIHLISGLGFCYLGMLSKETAIVGVLLLPVIFYYSTDLKISECIKKSIPFVLVAIFFFIQKKTLLGTLSGIIPDDIVNYPYAKGNVKLPTTFMLFVFSLRLLFVPHPLRYDYSYNQIPAVDFGNIWALLGVILFVGGVYVTYKQFFKKTTWGLGLSLFYITITPALAFTILRGGIFAERFLFFPSLGFCIVLGYALFLFFKTDIVSAASSKNAWIKSNNKLVLSFAILFLLYSFKTINRNLVWKNNITLFGTDLKTGANSAQNQRSYGDECISISSTETDPVKKEYYTQQGIAALLQSVKIHPAFGESYAKLGLAYQFTSKTDSAIYYYNKAIEASPTHFLSYYYMGSLYENMGKQNVASFYYNEAVRYNPQFQPAQKASDNLKKMGIDIQVNPLTSMVDTTSTNKNTSYYLNLGNYFASQGDYAKAAEAFNKSVELDNNNSGAYINLANCYGMLKQYPQSIQVFEKLLVREPQNLQALDNIALSYKFMGNMKKWEEYSQRANALRGN